MSVALELTRLQADRNTIRDKLINLGLATEVDNLDALAEAINDIVNCGNITATVKEGDTFKIPAGYHDGTGTVSGVAGGGNYNLLSKVITPTKKRLIASPDDGYYGLSDVTIEPIPVEYQNVNDVTATPNLVLTGAVYVTKDGTVTPGEMVNNGSVKVDLDATKITYLIPEGYHDGTGIIKIVIEEKTITPTKEIQEIVPTEHKVLSKVTINAIPEKYQDISGVTATADKVLTGYNFVSSAGATTEGSMPNNGDISKTFTGLDEKSSSITISAGYTSGGTISLTKDIENQLKSI